MYPATYKDRVICIMELEFATIHEANESRRYADARWIVVQDNAKAAERLGVAAPG